MWRVGTIKALRQSWANACEYDVELPDGHLHRALAYTQLVGTPSVGDTVFVSAAAAAKGLGTGGYLMIVANKDQLPADPPPAPGHIVKARYTPLQYMTLGVDEQESPFHDVLCEADSIEGMPVIVADLHSAMPAALAGILMRKPSARVAYIMDDGGALPAWFSQTAAQLTKSGAIIGTITAGQAFGGELESVNIHTALLAARLVWNADIAILTQGPGNLGTGTRWGFSGTSAGEAINAVNTLGGKPIGLLRMSNGDKRDRHFGLSHHSITALTRVALSPAECAVPDFADSDELSQLVSADVRAVLEPQLDALFSCSRLIRRSVSTAGLSQAFLELPVTLRTMGRSEKEDPLAFLAAGVAGILAADLL